ncbi:MAG: hypothetical protein R3Y58_02575 [Eubacteriales bacterium]
MEKNTNKQKKKWNIQIPHTYFIIFLILTLCAILTYILPAGSYDRVENEAGRMIVVADSFRQVESNPISLMDFLKAIPSGLEAQSALIFFVFICGGTFGVFDGTNALNVGINKLANRLNGREALMIIAITTIFSVLGATMAFDPQVIMFIPLGVALARRCGYDAITGIGMVLGGVFVGFSCGALNPYTTAVAQGIAGVPIFSGFAFRVLWQIATLVVTCGYIIRYARKVKATPESSFCYELELSEKESHNKADDDVVTKLTARQVLVIMILIGGLACVVYGSLNLSWGTTDMAAAFLGMGLLAGIVGGLRGNEICASWITGAKTMVFGALAIGLGRAILIVLENGMIMDTIVSGLASVLQLLPSSFVSVGMLFANVVINFFVPSGSGQATLVMPFMAAIATLTGVTMQTAIIAFQGGEGFSNIVIPTSSTTNACLGAGNVGYEKWIRFAMPLFLLQMAVCTVFTIIAAAINL